MSPMSQQHKSTSSPSLLLSLYLTTTLRICGVLLPSGVVTQTESRCWPCLTRPLIWMSWGCRMRPILTTVIFLAFFSLQQVVFSKANFGTLLDVSTCVNHLLIHHISFSIFASSMVCALLRCSGKSPNLFLWCMQYIWSLEHSFHVN